MLNTANITGYSESNTEQQPLFNRSKVLTWRSYRLLFAKIPTCSSPVNEKSQNRAYHFDIWLRPWDKGAYGILIFLKELN